MPVTSRALRVWTGGQGHAGLETPTLPYWTPEKLLEDIKALVYLWEVYAQMGHLFRNYGFRVEASVCSDESVWGSASSTWATVLSLSTAYEEPRISEKADTGRATSWPSSCSAHVAPEGLWEGHRWRNPGQAWARLQPQLVFSESVRAQIPSEPSAPEAQLPIDAGPGHCSDEAVALISG